MQLSDRIGRRMKLHDLHVLMTVVQVGSMNKSAALLNTTQPAISRSIAELEHVFGVRLLDRRPQGVEPTEYGRALLNCGVAVFDELRQGVKSIEFLVDPTAGEVRIGCNPFVAANFASVVIDRVSRRHPRMVFHVVSKDGEALRRDLRERKVDLLIARHSAFTTDEQFEFLFDESYVIAAGVQNPWSRRRSVKLAELAGESWVMPPPENVAWSMAVEAFRASGIDVPRATVFAAPEVRMRLLATGRFLSIFAESRAHTKRSEIKILPIKLPISRRSTVGVVTLKNRTLSPSAQLFIKTAHEVAKPLAK
jgi:DNA-binding transcriptional LysR family regulator